MSKFETRKQAELWAINQIDVDLRDKNIHVSPDVIDGLMQNGSERTRIQAIELNRAYDVHLDVFNRMETPGAAFDNLAGLEVKTGLRFSFARGVSPIAEMESNLTAVQFNVDEGGVQPGLTTGHLSKFASLDVAGDEYGNLEVEGRLDLKKVTFEGGVVRDEHGLKEANITGGVSIVPYILQPNAGIGAERMQDIHVHIGLDPQTYAVEQGGDRNPQIGKFYPNSQSLRETYHMMEVHHPQAVADMPFAEYSDLIEGLVVDNRFPNYEAIMMTAHTLIDPAADVRLEGATREEVLDFIKGDYVKTERVITIRPSDERYVNWEHALAEQNKHPGDPDIIALHDAQRTNADEDLESGAWYAEMEAADLPNSEAGQIQRGYDPIKLGNAIGLSKFMPAAGTPTAAEASLEAGAEYAVVANVLDNLKHGYSEVEPAEMLQMYEVFQDPEIGQQIVDLADKRYPDQMIDLRLQVSEDVSNATYQSRSADMSLDGADSLLRAPSISTMTGSAL